MQWLVVDKKTGRYVGVHNHEMAPEVDLEKYEVESYPDDTIKDEPAENFKKEDGQIIRVTPVIVVEELGSRIDKLPESEELKVILKEIAGVR